MNLMLQPENKALKNLVVENQPRFAPLQLVLESGTVLIRGEPISCYLTVLNRTGEGIERGIDAGKFPL